MSAAPRTVSTAPNLRQLGLALGAVLVAIAVVIAVALARPAAPKAPAAPAAPTTVQFDHGWSSAASGTRALIVNGTKAGGINYTGIPYQAVHRGVTVQGTNGGAIEYTGIPYSTSDSSSTTHGGRGTRFAR